MLTFVLAEGNFPFAVALGLMLGIAVLEGTMTMLGAGISQTLDSMLPSAVDTDIDMDVDMDLDVDAAPDIATVDGSGADFGDAELSADTVGSASALSRVLGWLCIGRVPVLILLVVFLTTFGLAGLGVQSIVASVFGAPLPSLLASIPAVLIALPSVRVLGSGLAKLIPKDETSAVGSDTFVGRIATITVGTARSGQPAEARLKDKHGQSHYVMLEPDVAGEEYSTGTRVLIVARNGSRFRGIINTSTALVDD